MTDAAHATHGTNMGPNSHTDPFAAQRTADNNPFGTQRNTDSNPFANTGGQHTMHDDETRRASDGSDYIENRVPLAQRDRRMSKEWDASKTPPSKFQKAEGSIFATPSSRDGHVARNKIHGFKDKVKEMKRSVGGGLGGKDESHY